MSAIKTGERPSSPLLPPTAAAPRAPDLAVSAQPHDQGTTGARTTKFTFYFTEEQLDHLDHLWERVRRTRGSRRRRVSKSEIVRLALDRLLTDFEQNPEAVIAALLQQPTN